MIWNPLEGIHIGFINLRFYSLMFVVAFLLGYYITKKIFINEKESMENLDTLFIWTVLSTLLGARLGHVFFYDWEYFRNHKMEILLPFKFDPQFEFTGFQGLASHGAAIAIVATMFFYSKDVIKRPILWVLDRVVIPVASGAIFVRIGNFFNSEIIGKVTNSDFGIRFIRDKFSANEVVNITKIQNVNDAYAALINDPKYAEILQQVPARHPAQLYESVSYIFVFFILFVLYWKTNVKEKQGFLFGLFLVLLWSVRFIVEYVKESQGGFGDGTSFSTGQWLSIPFVFIGFAFLILARKPLPKDFDNTDPLKLT